MESNNVPLAKDGFDPSLTRDNFPKIVRPSDEVNMLDCSIDVTDKESPVNFEECVKEHHRFYYLDNHHVYHKIMAHTLEMLGKSLAVDGDGNTLNEES